MKAAEAPARGTPAKKRRTCLATGKSRAPGEGRRELSRMSTSERRRGDRGAAGYQDPAASLRMVG